MQPLTPKVNVPASNPITKGKYELGRQLYFDPRVSLDGTVSCATCHNPAKGWTDGMPVSIGIDGQTGSRSAPSVLNTVYGKTMFWDGRAPSLEGQAQGPIQNPIEMGKQSYKEIIDRLRKIPGYREQFQKVFGTNVTLDGMAKAIATFERVAALSGNSKYDKYNAGDNKALSDSEKRGMVLFGLRLNTDDEFKTDVVLPEGEVHALSRRLQLHRRAVPQPGNRLGREDRESSPTWADGRSSRSGPRMTPAWARSRPRRSATSSRPRPTCTTAAWRPWKRSSSTTTRAATPNPALDPDMKKLNLTAQEKEDVVAFMKALSGETKKLDELLPTLPPGPDGKTVDPRPALGAPSKKVAAAFHPSPLN